MRTSIWTGLIAVALGIGVSSLADGLLSLHSFNATQTTATILSIIIFVITSATLLGIGAALIIHWIFGFGNKAFAAVAEIVLSVATFFVGIGAAAMTRNFWTGLQLFFTFATASLCLILLSFVSLFGGIALGVAAIRKYVKKRYKR